MHLVRLSVSETHFWILEPSRLCFLLFFSATPPPLFFLLNSLLYLPCFFFFFSWDCRSVFPISLLAQTLTSNFLCFLTVGARSSCGKKDGGHVSLNQFLCSPGSYWEVLRSSSPQGFIGLSCYQQLHLAFRIQLCQVEAHRSLNLPLLNQQFQQYVWGQSTKMKQQHSRSGLLKPAVWCASVWLDSQLQVPERLSF